jgi:hypothetical protein
MSQLTYFGTSVLDSTLTTASKMVTASGGSETSKTTVLTANHVYGEIWSQGSAGLSTVDAIPATPTGHGWIFYPGAGTFDTGTWSANITIASALWGGSGHDVMTVRFSKWDGSSYTVLGSGVVNASGTAKTVYSFSTSSIVTFATIATDGIYVELWWSDNNLYAVGDNPVIYISSSGIVGVANDMQITTANFSPASIPSTPSVASDTFTRANQSGWGTASDGSHTWTPVTGSLVYSILNNAGHGTGYAALAKTVLGVSVADQDATVTFQTTDAASSVGFALRSTGVSTHYACVTNGANSVRISKLVSGVYTLLTSSAVTFLANTKYKLRARVVGTTLSLKFWLLTDSEPGSWTLTTTDSVITGVGDVGLLTSLTLTSDTIDYDDFTLGVFSSTKDVVARGRIAMAQRKDLKARVRLASIVTANMSNDTFIRADQVGWGKASNGETWSLIDGGSSPSIASNTGIITAAADVNAMTLGTQKVSDANILIHTSVSASDDVGVVLRVKDASTYYALYWSHAGQLQVSRFIAGIETILATSPFTMTPTTLYDIRGAVVSQANGSALLNASIWADGGGEPAWMISYADTNPIIGSGSHGVYMVLAAAADTIKVTSYTAIATANPRDIKARAGVKLLGYADVRARAAIGGTSRVKDLGARGRVRGFASSDIASRVCIAEALQALPIPQSASLSFKVDDTFITTSFSDIYPYILLDSVQYGDTLDGRSTASFTLIDPTGAVHISYRQRVSIVHSVRGETFRGFVNTAQENNLPPNLHNSIAIVCIDEHWIPDKRTYEGEEFDNENAGDVACQLFSELTDDGVKTSYALLHETTQSDFATGTLNNVAAAANVEEGDLEIAAAGSVLAVSETNTADFLSGTLTNVQANSDGTLSLSSNSALQMVTVATLIGGGNLFSYIKIWAGAVTIAAGDVLSLGVWIASDSPSQKCGVDIIFTDGTNIRDYQPFIVDQNYLRVHPGTDLGDLAKDQWYDRIIPLGALAGKVTSYLMVACEGDDVGTYTSYFRYIQLKSSTGAVKANIYWGPQTMSYQQISRRGVTSSKVVQKWTYAKTGSRVSPAYGLNGVAIARSSLLSWKAKLPTDMTLLMETSVDGGQTYQPCTSGAAIPGILSGMNCGGQSVILRETLTNTGKDPTVFGTLDAVTVSVAPSFSCTKSDIYQVTTTVQDWQRGTLSNVSYANGSLSLGGVTRDWTDANTGGQTLFGTSGQAQQVSLGELVLNTATITEVKSRFDFAGNWQNFIAEIDMKLGDITSDQEDLGLVYRTTGWQGARDTYAYSAHVNLAQVTLARGSNTSSGAGAYTVIQQVTLSVASGNYHRMKVQVNGTNHKVYIDDILYINATDATYTAAGQMGARYWNGSTGAKFGSFNNFGVLPAMSGYRTAPALDLSSVGTVWDSWISWDDTPSTSGSAELDMDVSLDGGANWMACVKNADIPGISRGMYLGGKSLLTRQTITTQSATEQPALAALVVRVISQMQASGTRISPPISLSPVGSAGYSVVQWKSTEPNEQTHVSVDVSPNGTNWTDISRNNGGQIPFILPLQDPAYENTFVSDYGTEYTEGALAGSPNGVNATWIVDRSKHALVGTGGTYAFVAYNAQKLGDGEIIFDMVQAERGGCVWRLSNDYASCYELNIQDDTSQRTPSNSMRLMKVVNGIHAQLGDGATITFQRGVATRFKIVQIGKVITVTVSYPLYAADGVSILGGDTQTLTYTDASPLVGGMVALRSNGGINSYSYLRMQQYGDDMTNKMLYVRQRLSTADPLYTPQVEEITASVRGSTIATGALIPKTTYSVVSGSTNSIAQDLDDLAKQSNYWWRVKYGIPYFMPQEGIPAPFSITGRDLLYAANVNVIYNSDLYRNEQIMIGGIDIEGRQDIRIADGFRTSFDTSVAIDSVSSVLVGGNLQLVGQSNIDTGKDWYYQQGQIGISQDAADEILPYGTEVVINYLGQVPIIVKARNNGQIAYLAAIDSTSGVVTVVEQAEGLSADAEVKLALSRLAQYGKYAINLEWQTYRPGLQAGQFLHVSLDQHGLVNLPTIITSVECVPTMLSISGVQYMVERFTVQCTSGPLVGAWSNLFA